MKVYETCKNCKRDCKVAGLGYLALCPDFEPNSEKTREKYDRERLAFSVDFKDVMKRENRHGRYI